MKNSFYSMLFLGGLLFFSCKKSETSGTVESKIVLAVTVTHHYVPVPNFPVYLKKNTGTYPGRDSTLYDLRVLTNSKGIACFTGIPPGNHYLYGYGYDPGVLMNCIGYHPVIVSTSTVVNDTITTQLFVSE